jgi:hypothetical protein
MTETQLSNCLRALPRAKASPAFSSELRRAIRAGEAPRRRPLPWRLAAAFAMAACLIAVVQIGVMQYRRQQRLEALRVEQQQIQAELAALKKSAREAEPMVVLENDHGSRVVMDLDSAVQPASYRTFD